MKLLKDLVKYIKYRIKEKNYNFLIFCENNNLYLYIQHLIRRKNKKIALVSLEKINQKFTNIDHYYFETNLIRRIFFLKINVKYIYSSTPDLNNSLFMKSINKRCKYIFIQHSSVSLNMAYDDNAFTHFDYVQVINKFQSEEIDQINKQKIKKIRKIESKYSIFSENFTQKLFSKPKVLIAPTWNTDFYKLNLHYLLIDIFNENGIDYIFKPHYMSLQKNEFKKDFLQKKNVIVSNNIIKEINNYSDLVTDWSGIYFEFAYFNKKKPILIETKKKVRNLAYVSNTKQPIELFARNIIGKVVETNSLNIIPSLIMKKNLNEAEEIKNFFDNNFYI